MIAGDFKDFLTIKIKPRDDNVIDQYSRIFMVKVLLICSMVCGLSWYADKFNCILPGRIPRSHIAVIKQFLVVWLCVLYHR